MSYANNNGVRIHYHLEGEGPPLVLQHGSACTFRDWYIFGYVEALKAEYQLILIDARGHGKSDKPHDPESYELEHRANDVVAVLDDLGIKKAHYLGYSMGGWIGFGLAKYAAERIDSLIIGGGQPYATSWEGTRAVLDKGLDAFVAVVDESFGSPIPEWKAQFFENDVLALIACLQDRPDISDILPGIITPSLLYAGDADPVYEQVKKAASIIPNAIFFGLPGLDHVQGAVRSDLALPHIKDFLAEVESSKKVS